MVKKLGEIGARLEIAVNGTLFLTVFTGAGIDLWKSDGTEAGTVLVKELDVFPKDFTNVNETPFFTVVTDSGAAVALWKSDGTEQGTAPVKAIEAQNLTNVNGMLFFTAPTGDVIVCTVVCGFDSVCPLEVPLQGLWKIARSQAYPSTGHHLQASRTVVKRTTRGYGGDGGGNYRVYLR